MDIIFTLSRASKLWPHREAVVDGSVRLTYRGFAGRVGRLARVLEKLGVGEGQVVAIIAPNVHQFLETYYAAAVLGAVLNPVNFRLSSREIAAILTDSGARVLLAHTDFAQTVDPVVPQCAKVEAVVWIGRAVPMNIGVRSLAYEEALEGVSADLPERPAFGPDHPAHLYYTSGTTGTPKGVVLTHGNVVFHALAAVAELKLDDSDTWMHVAPLFHLADAWATFAVTWVGGRHVCVAYFDPALVMAVIHREKVTLSNLIPTMLNLMVNHEQARKHDYSSLRAILSGGAPIAPETVRRIVETFGCQYIQTYGMTETSPFLTMGILKDHLKGLDEQRRLLVASRTGRPFMGVDLKVTRPDGGEVAWDNTEVGEIVVRGPIVTPGYWNKPQATQEAFVDGWLRTGDLAVVDEEGYVNIVDRKKDMIISGGENVYSTEVEHVLYEHPAVLECAVIGVEDPRWGEAVKAVVVARQGSEPTEEELIGFVRDRLAHYKAPKSVAFVQELPRTGSGKILKSALKERFGGKRGNGRV